MIILKIPGNILYLLKIKQNHLLPNIFNDYLLNAYFQKYSAYYVEDYRDELRSNNDKILVNDAGEGSKNIKSIERKISDIARTSSTQYEYGSLYQKIIDYFKINTILELGTSFGIGTMFFSLASDNVKVTTIEACENIYNFTKREFEKRKISNVEFINGKFDNIFSDSYLIPKKFDLFFIDGNHNSYSVLKYMEYIEKNLVNNKYIIIFDDINWSQDMYKAWKEITRKHTDCFMLNIFRIGIVFKGYDYPKGKFIVNFIK